MIPSVERLKRACNEMRERDGGMRAGLPSIRADVSDIEATIAHIAAWREQAENTERELAEARARLAPPCAMHDAMERVEGQACPWCELNETRAEIAVEKEAIEALCNALANVDAQWERAIRSYWTTSSGDFDDDEGRERYEDFIEHTRRRVEAEREKGEKR